MKLIEHKRQETVEDFLKNGSTVKVASKVMQALLTELGYYIYIYIYIYYI